MIVYDPHGWRNHLFDVKGSMLREIMFRVATCVTWSAVVVAFSKFIWPIGMPSTVHSLVGVALGLLLVFRTNASYDRYWEGRRLWGSIINETRNLGRSATVLLRDEPELLGRVINWTAAFPYAAMYRLRDQKSLGPIAQRLPPAEVEAILAAANVPHALSVRLSATLLEARDRGMISDYLFAMLDQNVQLLIDYVGGCERIHRTPLPFVYMVHVRRALILYCFSLPFALVNDFGWTTILDTLFVAYIFFGIEEIGVEIEDPFGFDTNDLPLESFCEMIAVNLSELNSGMPTGFVSQVPRAGTYHKA